ncbi:hypothetical protein [Comamonas sp. GB3 AK4-5]|uniref:hypothetical protein n=1 Tax=Comamonas sp. GB3 AK4-5 TaxID=3231487 RepID=UPI00351EA3EF
MFNRITPWAIAALLALGLSAVAGTSFTPTAEPDVLPMAVPASACPPGFVGVWVDSTTAECLKELL